MKRFFVPLAFVCAWSNVFKHEEEQNRLTYNDYHTHKTAIVSPNFSPVTERDFLCVQRGFLGFWPFSGANVKKNKEHESLFDVYVHVHVFHATPPALR